MEFAGTKMIEALRRVVQRMHYTLEVMLVCVRWYLQRSQWRGPRQALVGASVPEQAIQRP